MKLLLTAIGAALLLVGDWAVAVAQEDAPRMTPIGCNYDGGPSWLAVGRAGAGPESNSLRVEIPGVDLVHAEAQLSPSSMHAYAPYAGPRVNGLAVVDTAVAPRHVDGVRDGTTVTIRFAIVPANTPLADYQSAGAITYVLVLNGRPTGCTRGQ